jgi:hypothetical protein
LNVRLAFSVNFRTVKAHLSAENMQTLSIAFMVRVAVLKESNYRRPTPAPKNKPLFYGPVDWTPKGNPRTGIGSIFS